MSKDNNNSSSDKKTFMSVMKNIFRTLGRWIKRMFLGASKDIGNVLDVEAIESPSKMTVKAFFNRKLAVAAMCILILLFLFSFIGPLFVPLDVSYSDSTMANVAPGYTFLNVPNGIKDEIETISGRSTFAVGLSKSGKVYVWGYTKLGSSKINIADIPTEVQNATIKYVAAGVDHVVAIDDKGNVYLWGNESVKTYLDSNQNPVEEYCMPTKVDINNVDHVVSGKRISAIIMKDGTMKLFGLSNSITNFMSTVAKENIKDIAFTSTAATVLHTDGTVTTTKELSTVAGVGSSIGLYLRTTKAVAITSTNDNVAVLTADNKLVIIGNITNNEDQMPTLRDGEYFVQVAAGSSNYSALTNEGRLFSWGGNKLEQCNTKQGKGVENVYCTGYQTYGVNAEGKVTAKYGLRGYLFGTDTYGRDIFKLVMHGGKMTMTIGAVAVIVSSVIAIIIGCISGYFGGWVDILLMRVTEIFASIPFLPFALILSAILRTSSISENGKIFIIMIILGLLSWTGLARMIRGQVLAEREKEFVLAAKAMGVAENKIAFKHILPNVISVILVSMTLDFAGCMLTESSLSYLGFGVQFPRPTWGNMLYGANNSVVIQNYWWQWLFPAIFLMIATISINIIGDTLRDILDPKSSNER